MGSLVGEPSIRLFRKAFERVYAYAKVRKVILLDSKGELSFSTRPTILDEVFTPDSSRYVDEGNYIGSQLAGRDPAFLDKEVVRIWGRAVQTPFFYTEEDERKDPKKVKGESITGINNLVMGNPDHFTFLCRLPRPYDVIAETSRNYLDLMVRLTGSDLVMYQQNEMGIKG